MYINEEPYTEGKPTEEVHSDSLNHIFQAHSRCSFQGLKFTTNENDFQRLSLLFVIYHSNSRKPMSVCVYMKGVFADVCRLMCWVCTKNRN